jgi:hypothetical protein
MNDDTAAPAPADDSVAFDRAEFASEADAAPACALCKRPLGQSYFTINAAIACEDCHHLVSSQVKESKGARAFMRAAGFGAAAALGGSIAWYAVAKITGMEIGLLAIAVGYVVGKAVRHGARGPGGRRYQALAMLLTYFSITGSYVPLVLKSLAEMSAKSAAAAPSAAPSAQAVPKESSASAPSTASNGTLDADKPAPSTEAPAAAPGLVQIVVMFVIVIGLALAAPFLGGASNIIGILLIGIALYEAWKFNRPVPLVMDGPLRTESARRDAPAPAPGG